MSAYIVGLTGGIGCGKSTVAALFTQKGIESVDADIVAREVVMPGTACLALISERFGSSILQENGELNRSALRDKIFKNPDDKLWLEQLLHPAIRQSLLEKLNALTSPYALLIAPLLFENKLNKYIDRALVIDLPESMQLCRAMARDNADEAQIKAIMAAQISRPKRLEMADDIIKNDSSVADLIPQVEALHQFYLQQASMY